MFAYKSSGSIDLFLKHLLPYLKVSLPLPEAIQCLGSGLRTFAPFASKLYPLVLQGYSLSLSLEILNASPVVIEWIRLGEETGKMTEAIESLLKLNQAKQSLRKTWVNILRYPVLILIFMMVAIAVLQGTVFPSLLKFYENKPLPLLTTWIFHYPLISSGVLLLVPGLVSLFLLPFKRLQTYLNICETLSIKLNAGVPLSQASPLKWRKFLVHGYSLSIVLKIHKEDPFLIHLVETGENTGNLKESFLQAKTFYQERTAMYLDKLQAYLPSMLMVLMSIFVGMLVLAVYLPLLQVSF